MKRRGFFSALGLGTVATAFGHKARAKPEVKRDIYWAREMTRQGHRVRLCSSHPSSVDRLEVTLERQEGPWEIVPQEVIDAHPADGGSFVLTAGDGAGPGGRLDTGVGRGGHIEAHAGRDREPW